MKRLLLLCALAALLSACRTRAGWAQSHRSLGCHACHSSNHTTGANSGDFRTMDAASATALCMGCHGEGGSAPPVYSPAPLLNAPAGNFYEVGRSEGNGHNVVWAGKIAPASGAQSPGGDFPAHALTCISCHDPHGSSNPLGSANAFGFRMLRKFVNGKDVSRSIGSTRLDQADLSLPASATNKNVYRDGNPSGDAEERFGAWCAACHSTFHGSKKSDENVGNGQSWLRHPTGTSIGVAAASRHGAPYDLRYPLVAGVSDVWTVQAPSFVSSESRVFCLTCHTAHASNRPFALRWKLEMTPTEQGCAKCHQISQ